MIVFKDLLAKQYKNNDCIAFEFPIVVDENIDENIPSYVARFVKLAGVGNGPVTISERWRVVVVLPKLGEFTNNSVYDIVFEMPRKHMDLTLICATGLRYLQYEIKNEIEVKMAIDFDIGESVEGM